MEEFFRKRVWHIPRPLPDEDALTEATRRIRAARRPLIVAGGGVIYSGATEALRRLCEQTGIPVGESAEIFGVLASLPRDVTILFIEHDMNLVFRFAERITVLVEGSILVEGAPEEIAANPRVREVYLGEGGHG